MKTCSRCRKEFEGDLKTCETCRENIREYARKHRDKKLEKKRERYAENREKICEKNRARTTGWSKKQHDLAMLVQEGRCGICTAKTKLLADHDYNKPLGEGVRKLLCNWCNISEGIYWKHQRPAGRRWKDFEDYYRATGTVLPEDILCRRSA